jgi:hypothetical protein
MPEEEIKICKTCFKEKTIADFYYRKDTGSYKNVCKRCQIDGKNIKSQESKLCKHCGIAKPKTEFQKAGGGKWLQPYCKACDSIRKKRHYHFNLEARTAKGKIYYETNKHTISAKGKEERRLAAIGRPKRQFKRMSVDEKKRRKSECDKRYRENNPQKITGNKIKYKQSGRALETAKAWQAKQRHKIEFVTKRRLRGRIYMALKRGVKSESTMQLLGCSIEFFKTHFQSLFKDGMTWDRYLAGEIVIDHIKPCAKFNLTDPEEQNFCFHYTNLQPLWKLDNLKKGTSYTEKEELCPMIK